MVNEKLKGFRTYARSAREELGYQLKGKRNLTQEQMAERIYGDCKAQYLIARLETGARVPSSFYEAQCILDGYGLNPEEKNRAFLTWFNSPGYARGPAGFVVEPPTVSGDTDFLAERVVDLHAKMVDSIYKVRMGHNPQLAVRLAREASNDLQDTLRKLSTSKITQALQRTYGLVLCEEVIAHNEFLLPRKNFVVTRPIINKIQVVANDCDDKELFGIGNFLRGNNYYLIKRYDKSLEWLTKTLDTVKTPDYKLWVLRGLLLDWAYLQHEDEFKKVVDQVKNLVEGGQCSKLERICEVHEAIGRGWGLLGSPKTFEAIEQGWNLYHQLESQNEGTATRFIQLVRGALVALRNLAPAEKKLMENLGVAGLTLAQQYGYWPYIRSINELLKILD